MLETNFDKTNVVEFMGQLATYIKRHINVCPNVQRETTLLSCLRLTLAYTVFCACGKTNRDVARRLKKHSAVWHIWVTVYIHESVCVLHTHFYQTIMLLFWLCFTAHIFSSWNCPLQPWLFNHVTRFIQYVPVLFDVPSPDLATHILI